MLHTGGQQYHLYPRSKPTFGIHERRLSFTSSKEQYSINHLLPINSIRHAFLDKYAFSKRSEFERISKILAGINNALSNKQVRWPGIKNFYVLNFKFKRQYILWVLIFIFIEICYLLFYIWLPTSIWFKEFLFFINLKMIGLINHRK